MKTLKQLIKQLKFNYVNDSINESNFPETTRGKVTKIFRFENSFTRDEAIKRLDEEGYRPANPYELLEWAKKNWNGKDYILALEQTYLDADGDADVIYLWCDSGCRKLGLSWASFGWDVGTL